MFKIKLYQMPKSGRWRWKLMYNKMTLARADYHYASATAAKKAFGNMMHKASKQFTEDGAVPYEIIK